MYHSFFIILLFSLFSILYQQNNAAILYKSRAELNETIYSPTRIMVDNFIDRNRMATLERFVKRFKRLFQDFGNNYKLPYMDIIFSGLFPDEEVHKRNCTWGLKCVPAADQALQLLKSTTQLRYCNDTELIKEIETYIYVRDKIYEYASEMFKTKLTSSEKYGGYFYFFPPKTPVEMRVNGTGYIFPPHVDYCPFKSPTFDRPLEIGLDITHNSYRRYTSILYFDDMMEDDGGVLTFMDLPSKDKFPVVKGSVSNKIVRRHPLPGSTGDPGVYTVRELSGGTFADKEAKFTRILSKRGKLVLLSAFDIHAVTEYLGSKERWGFVMFMTTHKLHELQLQQILPDETKLKEVSRLAFHTPPHGDKEGTNVTADTTSHNKGKSKTNVDHTDHSSSSLSSLAASTTVLEPHLKTELSEDHTSTIIEQTNTKSLRHQKASSKTADPSSDLLTDITDNDNDSESKETTSTASRHRHSHGRYLYTHNDREYEYLLKKEREYNSKYWRH